MKPRHGWGGCKALQSVLKRWCHYRATRSQLRKSEGLVHTSIPTHEPIVEPCTHMHYVDCFCVFITLLTDKGDLTCGYTQMQSDSWIIQLCLAGHTTLQPFIWQLVNAGVERWEVLLEWSIIGADEGASLPAFYLERQFYWHRGVKCDLT